MALLIDVLAAGVIDSSGNPLNAGKAYVYEVGTTTATNVYQDSDLTTLHSNPITLDSVGRAEAYVPQDVRVLIEDSSGVTVLDIDSIGSSAGSSGDFAIGNNSSDHLILNASVQGDLLPSLTNVYNVGSSALRWLKGWFNNIDISGGINITGTSGHSASAEFCNEIIDSYTRPVTGSTVAVRGVAISGSSATFTSTSTSAVDITNLAINITTSGRPVRLELISDGGGASSSAGVGVTSTSPQAAMEILVIRDSTEVARLSLTGQDLSSGGTNYTLFIPPGSVSTLDTPAAGTYDYKIQALRVSGVNFSFFRCKLVAYEL